MDALGKHLPAASLALRARSRRPSASSDLTPTDPRTESTAEANRRYGMLVKLFSLYPQGGGEESTKLRMLAYHGELADVHVDLLGQALRRVVRSKGDFLPSVFEIRRAAALVLRAVRAGRPALAPASSEPAEIDVERYLALAPRPGERCVIALAPGARIGAGG